MTMPDRRGCGILEKFFIAGCLAFFSLFTAILAAQENAARITRPIDDAERATLAGTHPPVARAENDSGRVPPGTLVEGVNIVFTRTPAQETALQALIAAQQDPTSASYHQWLTLDEFAARFGAADSDIAKVQSWLVQHGFNVASVSRSKDRISFSGTVGQVEAAFGTEIHYYKANGETNFAPASDISVPAALSAVVRTVSNLSTFRPKPRVINQGPRPAVNPDFTSSQSGNHFLTPADVATIYDITTASTPGYNGTGQSIAGVGQS